ncbi:MAG: glycosyltransferase, partial [Oscillospiraceae bacterium]|nr:glycosyltransferase [Oscillospiraceae bacterium]
MKITLLTESFPPVMDGAAATVDSYARCIHERGGAVTVVVPRMPAHGEYEPPYPVIYYPSIGTVADGEYPFGFPYLPRTLKACREYAPDIIHAHSPFMSMTLALRMRRKLGKPVILTVHAKYAEELERYTRSPFMRRRALEMMMKHVNAADEVWVSSLSAAQELKRMGYTGGHFHLPKGTDFTVRETESDTISELRTRFSIPYNVPILLYVGRLVWQKNIRGILDALDILRERRQPFCMLFVGDGPDRTAMEDYTAARRLDGLVHFVGRVSDRTLLQAFYSFADLLVFPSLADNGPQVILEAAACSLPALAATGGAASELIEDGVSGFICSP